MAKISSQLSNFRESLGLATRVGLVIRVGLLMLLIVGIATGCSSSSGEADGSAEPSSTGPTSLPTTSELRATTTEDSRLERAVDLLEASESEKAFGLFDDLVEGEPDNVEYLIGRARALSALGMPEDAIVDLSRAIELDSTNSAAFMHLGRNQRLTGDLEGARVSLERSISLNPDQVNAHNNLSIVASLEGKQTEALSHLETAIEVDPEFAPSYNNRGILYLELEEYELALEDFSSAADLDSDFASAVLGQAVSLNELDRHNEAIEVYDSMISDGLLVGTALSNRGLLYEYDLSEYNLALTDFDTLVEWDPADPDAYRNRARLLCRMGRYEEAVKDLLTVFDTEFGTADDHFALGIAHAMTDNRQDAVSSLSNALGGAEEDDRISGWVEDLEDPNTPIPATLTSYAESFGCWN